MPNFSCIPELLERTDGFFNGHFAIDRVQLIQIDPAKAQAFQAAVHGLLEMFRSAVRHPLARSGASETAFRRDHESFRVRIKRLGNEQLAGVRTVCVGRVDQVHAKLHRTSENF